jgi:hypothetical protein
MLTLTHEIVLGLPIRGILLNMPEKFGLGFTLLKKKHVMQVRLQSK